MRTTLISSFIAIAMIATVFLGWSPEAEAGCGTPVSAEDCCTMQIEENADCFCASIFGGKIRQVRCTFDAVCPIDDCVDWDCNIEPVKCHWWERGKVLQKFNQDGGDDLECVCDDGIS